MIFDHLDGLPPDRGPVPAYRLAPDSPAEIAADLARLCAPAGQNVSAMGNPISAGTLPTRAEGIALSTNTANELRAETGAERIAPASASPSRRLALFGAAAALLVPLVIRPAATRVADADHRLIAMGAELDRTLDGAAYAFDEVRDEDDQDRRLDRANALTLDMVAVPAVGLAGVLAKAKAYLDPNSYDVVNLAELADSLAEDAERVIGGLSA